MHVSTGKIIVTFYQEQFWDHYSMKTATSNGLLWKEMYRYWKRESISMILLRSVGRYVDRYIDQGVHKLHKIPNLNISARMSNCWSISELLKLSKKRAGEYYVIILVILQHIYYSKLRFEKKIFFLEFWFWLYINCPVKCRMYLFYLLSPFHYQECIESYSDTAVHHAF